MRRASRILGTLMIVSGVVTLGWAVLVWQWQDPFSALYTHLQQNRLASAYDERARAYEAHRVTTRDLAAVRREVAVEAREYRRSLHTGDPVGRLKIGRVGLSMIVVQGTDHETLKKGPGHYPTTGIPGEGRLIYVAAHRTSYLAPFSHIDAIRPGDYVSFDLPYATFTYRVARHYVVAASDTRMLVNHSVEILRLQACHPRFFASHRYIVDARLVAMEPRGGETIRLPARLAAEVTAAGN